MYFAQISAVRTCVCAYMDATLLKTFFSAWGSQNIGKKILQSSRFNILADFYIKVFGLKIVTMKVKSILPR